MNVNRKQATFSFVRLIGGPHDYQLLSKRYTRMNIQTNFREAFQQIKIAPFVLFVKLPRSSDLCQMKTGNISQEFGGRLEIAKKQPKLSRVSRSSDECRGSTESFLTNICHHKLTANIYIKFSLTGWCKLGNDPYLNRYLSIQEEFSTYLLFGTANL